MSVDDILLGLELGSSVCKAVAVSVDGRVMGASLVPTSRITGSNRSFEPDAREWWRMATWAARQAVSSSGVSGKSVRGIAVCSQGRAVVPVDANYYPLVGVLSCGVSEVKNESDKLVSRLGLERLFHITGQRPESYHSLACMMSLASSDSHTFARTHRILHESDFIAQRFSGEVFTDHSLASASMAYDVNRQEWSDEVLDAAGIPAGLLPEIRTAGSVHGNLLKESAEVIGLQPGTALAVGAQDRKSALFAAGLEKGTVAISLGTSSVISAAVEQPVFDDEMRIPCLSGLFPGQWVLEGVVPNAGGALAWLKNAFFALDYAAIDSLAEDHFEGTENLFFYPHLAGSGAPIWGQSDAGAFTGITLSTETEDVMHDAALVFADGLTYSLCVLSRGTSSRLAALSGIAEISNEVYNYLSGLPESYL